MDIGHFRARTFDVVDLAPILEPLEGVFGGYR